MSQLISPRKRREERLIVLFLLGILALNYPLLAVFNTVELLFGVPGLYFYLFLMWFILIVLNALIMHNKWID